MPRTAAFLLALATLSAPAWLYAQVTNGTSLANAPADSSFTQSQPAPIERGTFTSSSSGTQSASQAQAPNAGVTSSSPAPGVFLRSSQNGAVSTSSNAHHVELRVDHGIANITVHDPAPDTLILVDLPGGQTQLLENGLYTFNADSGTVRVLHGEADVFPGQATNPTHVREGQQVTFMAEQAQVADLDPAQARADLLPGGNPEFPGNRRDHGDESYGYAPYGYALYGYGFYGYPYYAWGYPWGWYGYPWGVGLGFGWYGGYGFHHGYGFRGGYGGFHGYGPGFHQGGGFRGGSFRGGGGGRR